MKLCAAYNRFVKSATKLKKTDGPDLYKPSKYKVLTYFQDKSSDTNDDIEDMDDAIAVLANKLSNSNPEAMSMLKKVFWEGTENWDQLLIERAAMSGQLVLSDFTRNAINEFKKK